MGFLNLLMFFWFLKFLWVLIIDIYGNKIFWFLISYVGIVFVFLFVRVDDRIIFIILLVLFNLFFVMVDLMFGKILLLKFYGD